MKHRITLVTALLLLALPVSMKGALFWRGGLAGNVWDINTTDNWFSGTTASVYSDGGAVTFDNSGATNQTGVITTVVSPASVKVSTSSNYTFTGSGRISGTTALTKYGAGGTLTLSGTNTRLAHRLLLRTPHHHQHQPNPRLASSRAQGLEILFLARFQQGTCRIYGQPPFWQNVREL